MAVTTPHGVGPGGDMPAHLYASYPPQPIPRQDELIDRIGRVFNLADPVPADLIDHVNTAIAAHDLLGTVARRIQESGILIDCSHSAEVIVNYVYHQLTGGM
jgi:hypothetical protein